MVVYVISLMELLLNELTINASQNQNNQMPLKINSLFWPNSWENGKLSILIVVLRLSIFTVFDDFSIYWFIFLVDLSNFWRLLPTLGSFSSKAFGEFWNLLEAFDNICFLLVAGLKFDNLKIELNKTFLCGPIL